MLATFFSNLILSLFPQRGKQTSLVKTQFSQTHSTCAQPGYCTSSYMYLYVHILICTTQQAKSRSVMMQNSEVGPVDL